MPLYYVSRYTKLESKEAQNNVNINSNNDNIDESIELSNDFR